MNEDNLKDKSDDELISMIYDNSDQRITWGVKAKARAELHNRQKGTEKKMESMTFWILILTIFLAIIAVNGIFPISNIKKLFQSEPMFESHTPSKQSTQTKESFDATTSKENPNQTINPTTNGGIKLKHGKNK